MNKIEMIIFAIISVIALLVTFDFTVYVISSAPRSSYFTKRHTYFRL